MPICSPSICLAFGLMWVRGGFGGQRWLFSSPFRESPTTWAFGRVQFSAAYSVTAKRCRWSFYRVGAASFRRTWLGVAFVCGGSGQRPRRVAGRTPFAGGSLWGLGPCPGSHGRNKKRTSNHSDSTRVGVSSCAALYALTQFVTLATIGTSATDRPVAEPPPYLIGPAGALFVTVAVMLSTYGNISACILNAPRIIYALAANGDAPAAFGKLHPKFRTPAPCHCGLYAIRVVAGCFRNVRLGLGARGGSLTDTVRQHLCVFIQAAATQTTEKAYTSAKNTRHARNRHIGSAANAATGGAVAADGRDSTGCYRKLVVGQQG